FQAEDGIRARNVTGVQTCALPISQQISPPNFPILVSKETKDSPSESLHITLSVPVGLIFLCTPNNPFVGEMYSIEQCKLPFVFSFSVAPITKYTFSDFDNFSSLFKSSLSISILFL